jgi:hypothetical protein
MFVYFTKADGSKRYVNPNLVEGFSEGKIEGRIVCYVYTIEGDLELTPEQYNEIMAQLDALGLLYKPSEPLHNTDTRLLINLLSARKNKPLSDAKIDLIDFTRKTILSTWIRKMDTKGGTD